MAALALLGCGEPRERSDGGALEVLLPSAPIEIDPRFVLDAQGLRVSRLIFSGLVAIDPYTLEVLPELAERIDVDPSGTRYTATLRAGLSFADGSVLDADDVRSTYESIRDPDMGSRFAETYARIERIETPDPLTITFVIDGPHAPFLTDLELPIVRSEDRARHLHLEAVGSGPFALVSATERAMTLEGRSDYWRRVAHPHLRLLVVRDESTRALRMLSGSADVAPFAIAPLLVPSFEEDARFEVVSAPGPGTAYLAFQTEAGALSNALVRRALGHAIDRVALMHSKFGERAELACGFIPTAHWAYVEQASPDFDPARARALLDDAGFPQSGDAPRFSIRIRTSTDRTRAAIARAIAAMWRDVGIDVEVGTSEVASLLSDLDAGRFEVALMTLPEVFEPHVLHWFFASSRGERPNRFRFRSAALDTALEAGRVAVTREDRFAAYAEAQRVLASELPALPLWHEHVVVVSRAGASMRAPSDGRLGFLSR
jgi:peptide/nickel transport system substrate-binding protein